MECFRGGGRENLVKHGARGPAGRGQHRRGGGAGPRAGKDRAGALCTRFTLVVVDFNISAV